MIFRTTVALLGLGVALASPAIAGTTQDSVQYTYDQAGHLLKLTYANGTTITYSYDLAGNRLGQQVACGGGGC